MREKLLKSCRYYKGQAENPFKDSRSALWSLERDWVKMAESASTLLDEYLEGLRLALPDLAKSTDVHPSLVALLYDRYTHFGGTASGFPAWFARNYPKSH